MIGYIDSSIISQGNGVSEVLMLMSYCRTHVLNLMNSRYVTKIPLFCEYNFIFLCFYGRFMVLYATGYSLASLKKKSYISSVIFAKLCPGYIIVKLPSYIET